MKKSLPFCIWFICACLYGNAQVNYIQIPVLAGAFSGGGHTVNVTPFGNFYQSAGCLITGPWTVGNGNSGGVMVDFDKPVTHLRIDMVHISQSVTVSGACDTVSLEVNGVFYPLTASMFGVFQGCGSPQAIIHNGRLVTGAELSVQARINISGCIRSVRLMSHGADGVVVSMYYGTSVLATNSGPVCVGDTVQLWADASGPSARYRWNGPGGFTADEQNPILAATTIGHSGVYTLTALMCDTTYTDTTSLVVHPLAKPQISYSAPVCEGAALSLNADFVVPPSDIRWQGPAGLSSNQAAVSIPDVGRRHSGWYFVEAITSEGCVARDSVDVVVGRPTGSFRTEVICAGSSILFDGKQLSAAGTYTAQYINASGCDSVASLTLVVLPAPEVNMQSLHTGQLCIGDTVALKASGAASYRWLVDGAVVPAQEDAIEWRLSNLNTDIAVAGSTPNGCVGTARLLLSAESCCEVFMPNAFTPNGDGRNDRFGPVTRAHYSGYRLSVFDRWGKEIFRTWNGAQPWDGTYLGQPAVPGTYFYRITVDCPGGKIYESQGDVTLIR